MTVPHGRYDEMPLRGQWLVLAIAVLAALGVGGLWFARGAPVREGEADLGMAVLLVVACQWVSLGMMLRPKGRGLRLHAWRRRLAWVFSGCHLVFGVLNAVVPVFVARPGQRLYGTDRWGYCVLIAGAGIGIGIAAWVAGRPRDGLNGA